MSDRQTNNISYAVTEHMFGRTMDIPFWADAFRRGKGRLPHNITELSEFVSHQTGSRVQLEHYDRVEFALLPSGQRQAACYAVADGVTNKSVMTWGKPDR